MQNEHVLKILANWTFTSVLMEYSLDPIVKHKNLQQCVIPVESLSQCEKENIHFPAAEAAMNSSQRNSYLQIFQYSSQKVLLH